MSFMSAVFLICAVIGGTILVCQFVMTLVGFGHHDLDVGHDVSADVGAGDAAGAHVGDLNGHDAHGQHGSTWLFGIVSFRTLVAAATFFGLAGLASNSAELSALWQLAIAVVCGVGAMYGTHWTMRQFNRLSEDGTVRINRAVGQEGTVYLTIPPGGSSTGKVQVKVQDRLMEYEAMTNGDTALNTGARVVVVGIEGGKCLRVEPVREQIATESKS